jgi:glycosyltransferase involved in cell wall biosynthesis
MSVGNVTWHLLTGEYPPRPGGVSDYSASIARGLVEAGETVHVWTADAKTSQNGPVNEDGVIVHRWRGGWLRADLTRLGTELDAMPSPRRLLVQYTPPAWGFRGGANLIFGPWLVGRRRRGDQIWSMIHEPYYPWRLIEKPTRWLLAVIHRVMMYHLFLASTRLFVASETYFARLRPYDPKQTRPMVWSPIPSGILTRQELDPAAVAEVRERLASSGRLLIGHFGTFGATTDSHLRNILPELLAADPERHVVLMGRGGREFTTDLVLNHPALAGRITATGGLAPADVAAYLAACDVLIQPYPDGISTRRSSVMGGLGLGMPIVTHQGYNTEPLWEEFAAVRLVRSDRGMIAATAELLADPDAREALGRRALELYEQRFAVAQTVEQLLSAGGLAVEQPR